MKTAFHRFLAIFLLLLSPTLLLGENRSRADIAAAVIPSVLLISAEGGPSPSQGTGFIVSKDGLVVTNFHVVEGHTKFSARTYNGSVFNVRSLASIDKVHDLAILKLDAKNVSALELDTTDSVKAGSSVLVIGNPLGLDSTVTEGIISAQREVEGSGPLLQITAPISPGSSGSPVLNDAGHVIAVAVLKLIKGESLNFAIPSRFVAELLSRTSTDSSSSTARSAGLYLPNTASAGSPEEDAACSTDSLFLAVKTVEAKSDYFAMLSPAKRLTEKYPQSALAARVRSDALYYAELNDDAISEAKRSLDLDPLSARGWNNLAILYNKTGGAQSADAVYKHALKIAPDDAKLLIEYSDLEGVSQSTAISALSHAASLLQQGRGFDLESQAYQLEAQLVAAYIRRGLSKSAFDAATLFLKTKDNDAFLWLGYAKAALALKKYEEVRPALERAYAIDKKYEALMYGILGDSEHERGRIASALDSYQRGYTADPTNESVLIGLISTTLDKDYLSDSDYNKLDEWVNGMTRLDPEYGKQLRESVTLKLRQRRK